MVNNFIAGIVGTPFGLKGSVKIKPLSGEIEHLLKLNKVMLRLKGVEISINIEESSAVSSALIMKFAGYDSPEAVKILAGAELLVDRNEAAPLKPGEFYIEDLKGLSVFTAAGDKNGKEQILGHITAILEGGHNDLAEIQLMNGQKKLIPFKKEFFSEINPENGRVTLQNLWILE